MDRLERAGLLAEDLAYRWQVISTCMRAVLTLSRELDGFFVKVQVDRAARTRSRGLSVGGCTSGDRGIDRLVPRASMSNPSLALGDIMVVPFGWDYIFKGESQACKRAVRAAVASTGS
jgi:hypothetical protein